MCSSDLRLGDHVPRVERRQRVVHERHLVSGDDDIEIIQRDERQEPLDRGLDRRPAGEQREEGLRSPRGTEGPEARPPAASKDHRVGSTAHRGYRTPAREPAELEASADPEDATEEAWEPERGAANDKALLKLCANRVPE